MRKYRANGISKCKREFKRFLSFLMCVALTISSYEIPTIAGETITIEEILPKEESVSGNCGENATYYIDDDGVLHIKGTGSVQSLEELGPARYDISEVVIEGSISTLEKEAFDGFTGLNTVKIVSIADEFTFGSYVFQNSTSLKKLDMSGAETRRIKHGTKPFGSSGVQVVQLPLGKGLDTQIEEDLFLECFWLESLNVPNDNTVLSKEVLRRSTIDSIEDDMNPIQIMCNLNSKAHQFCAETSGYNAVIEGVPYWSAEFLDGEGSVIKRISVPDKTEVTQADAPDLEGVTGWRPSLDDVYSVCNDIAFQPVFDEVRAENDISAEGDENNVTYSLSDDGVLTIAGYGAMKDFASAADVPWWEQRNSIRAVVFKGAITHIGERAFSMLHGCDSISFDGITDNFSIGERAFSNIPIESLDLPSNVTEVGNWAFEDATVLKQVSIHGGGLNGNPFIGAPKYEDEYLTVSFYDTLSTKLRVHPDYATAKFGYNTSGKMMNLVFDDSSAIENYSSSIAWDKINDLYLPDAAAFAQLPAAKDAGCNVAYSIQEDGTAHITSIQKTSFASQLNLPETILGHKVTCVDCDIPTGLSILHTGTPHVTGQDGTCALCGRQQYHIEMDPEGGKYLICDFDKPTDYYILELVEGYDIYMFELTEDFELTSDKTFEIPEGYTLVIPENATFTIEPGADFVLDGTVIVEDGGSFYNAGMISGDGSFQGDGKFVTVPTEDTIRFVGEENFYEGMPDFEIIFVYIIDWFDIEFEVVYEDEAIAQSYYEKFTATTEYEERFPENWTRVTDVSKHGIYRYVYVDPETGKTVKKRFEVRKPYGKATISMADWYYGDTASKPVYASDTNADKTPSVYYKKASEGESAFTRVVPTKPGDYTVRVSYPGNADYQQAVASADFTIKKRPVMVKIADAARTYGEANPLTYDYTITGGKGLTGSDTIDALGVKPYCTATTESDAGTYDILASVSSDNYDVTVQKGILTVKPMTATLTVESSCLRYEKTFGEEPFALTGITKTGDGTLHFDVDPAGTDILSVDAQGNVTILGTGDTTVIVSLPDTKNATGALPATITVSVAKAQAPEATGKVYYLCTQENEIAISLADYLPADCGTVDYSGFDASTHVTYPQGDKTICRETPNVDGEGMLTFVTKARDAESTIDIVIPVSMSHYEDTDITLEINLLEEQETRLADGESVHITEDGLYYGNALGSLTFADATFVGTKTGEVVTGTLTFANPTRKPQVGNGTYDADWIFTPDASYNGLYAECSGSVTISVYKATPVIREMPVVLEQVYDPEKTLSMVRLIGGETYPGGEWSWIKPNATVTCGNAGYDALFTPNDENYESVIRRIPVAVQQAQPQIIAQPDTTAITYKETLKASMLSGGQAIYRSTVSTNSLTYTIPGTFSWVDETLVPTIADSDLSQYEVLFTPDDPNYAPVKTTATVHVKKAGLAPNYKNGLQHLRVNNTIKTVADVTGLPVDWKWEESDKIKTISQNDTCTVTAVYDGTDKGNYEYETMIYEIYREACQQGEEILYTMTGEKAPTCTEDGIGHRACALCKDVLETHVQVAALGHQYGEPEFAFSISENAPADTTAQAIFTCERSGCRESEMEHRHMENCQVTYDETVPTCELDGNVTYVAKTTFRGQAEQKTKLVIIPKLGHLYEPVYFAEQEPQTAAVETVMAAETLSDNTAGKNCFVWGTGDRTCSVTFVCKRCQNEETVTESADSQTTSTCTQDGIKTVTADICFAGYTLHGEKQVFDPATGHHFYNREFTLFPTCTESGYWTFSCIAKGCTATQKQYVNPLGHTGGTATCAHPAVCDRCGEAYGDIDPEHHEQDEIRNAMEPSCLSDGYTGDIYCMACQKLKEQGKIILNPNKTHTWDEGVVVREATVLQNGQKKYTCKKCGAIRLQILYFEKKDDSAEPEKPGDGEKTEEIEDDIKENIYQMEEDPKDPGKVIVIYVKPVKPKKIIVIPASVTIGGKKYAVTKIAPDAFAGDTTITKVTVGKNVTKIPDGCFSGCVNLKSVTLPDRVKEIGAKSFYKCKKLTTVKIGKNLTTIGDQAFAGCIRLQKITIPAKVIRLGSSIFYGDKRLKTIVIKTRKLTDKKMHKKTFRGIGAKVVIKVPKAKRKFYQKLFQKKGLTKKNKLKNL